MRDFLLAVILFTGCCSHGGAVPKLRRLQALNEGHAADKSLPKEARDIALDNAAVDALIVELLGGPNAPAKYRKRVGR